jgi:hypothetical protein
VVVDLCHRVSFSHPPSEFSAGTPLLMHCYATNTIYSA